MKIEDINQAKVPFVKIDKKMDKFKGKVLFQDKLDMANKLFEKAILPNVNK